MTNAASAGTFNAQLSKQGSRNDKVSDEVEAGTFTLFMPHTEAMVDGRRCVGPLREFSVRS